MLGPVVEQQVEFAPAAHVAQGLGVREILDPEHDSVAERPECCGEPREGLVRKAFDVG